MANIHISIRTPEEYIEKVDEDAKSLRRSRSSIISEILERYYENGGRHLSPATTTTTTKKKAGKH